MNKKLTLLSAELGEVRVKFDENLHYHTGSNRDIIAEAFYIATSQKELIHSLNTALELGLAFTILNYDNLEVKSANLSIKGLVIKNRSHIIKISGIKGKFVVGSMGIDQVLLEVDSGVSLSELTDYFIKGKLVPPVFSANQKLTLAEALMVEFGLQGMVETIKVWEAGMIDEVNILEFQPKKHVMISVVLKARSSVLL